MPGNLAGVALDRDGVAVGETVDLRRDDFGGAPRFRGHRSGGRSAKGGRARRRFRCSIGRQPPSCRRRPQGRGRRAPARAPTGWPSGIRRTPSRKGGCRAAPGRQPWRWPHCPARHGRTGCRRVSGRRRDRRQACRKVGMAHGAIDDDAGGAHLREKRRDGGRPGLRLRHRRDLPAMRRRIASDAGEFRLLSEIAWDKIEVENRRWHGHVIRRGEAATAAR